MAGSLLPPSWQVPQVFKDRLGNKVGRQRVMLADGHLLLIVHKPPAPDEDDRQGRYFWRQPDGTWNSSDLGSGARAVASHLAEYAAAIEEFDRLEQQATSAEEYFQVLEGLAPVQRATRNLHHVLQEARQAVPADREVINFRDRAYEMERRAELLYIDAKNALDYVIARQAEQQAKASHRMAVSAHRLNLLAAFFFPIVTMTAIFGVNLRHGLERAYAPYLFLGMVLLGLVSGAVLTSFVIERSQAAHPKQVDTRRRLERPEQKP